MVTMVRTKYVVGYCAELLVGAEIDVNENRVKAMGNAGFEIKENKTVVVEEETVSEPQGESE